MRSFIYKSQSASLYHSSLMNLYFSIVSVVSVTFDQDSNKALQFGHAFVSIPFYCLDGIAWQEERKGFYDRCGFRKICSWYRGKLCIRYFNVFPVCSDQRMNLDFSIMEKSWSLHMKTFSIIHPLCHHYVCNMPVVGICLTIILPLMVLMSLLEKYFTSTT